MPRKPGLPWTAKNQGKRILFGNLFVTVSDKTSPLAASQDPSWLNDYTDVLLYPKPGDPIKRQNFKSKRRAQIITFGFQPPSFWYSSNKAVSWVGSEMYIGGLQGTLPTSVNGIYWVHCAAIVPDTFQTRFPSPSARLHDKYLTVIRRWDTTGIWVCTIFGVDAVSGTLVFTEYGEVEIPELFTIAAFNYQSNVLSGFTEDGKRLAGSIPDYVSNPSSPTQTVFIIEFSPDFSSYIKSDVVTEILQTKHNIITSQGEVGSAALLPSGAGLVTDLRAEGNSFSGILQTAQSLSQSSDYSSPEAGGENYVREILFQVISLDVSGYIPVYTLPHLDYYTYNSSYAFADPVGDILTGIAAYAGIGRQLKVLYYSSVNLTSVYVALEFDSTIDQEYDNDSPPYNPSFSNTASTTSLVYYGSELLSSFTDFDASTFPLARPTEGTLPGTLVNGVPAITDDVDEVVGVGNPALTAMLPNFTGHTKKMVLSCFDRTSSFATNPGNPDFDVEQVHKITVLLDPRDPASATVLPDRLDTLTNLFLGSSVLVSSISVCSRDF